MLGLRDEFTNHGWPNEVAGRVRVNEKFQVEVTVQVLDYPSAFGASWEMHYNGAMSKTLPTFNYFTTRVKKLIVLCNGSELDCMVREDGNALRVSKDFFLSI